MGKSHGACFKIIACVRHSVDHEDLQASESKTSSDRRVWSLQKRSARHRVLSNTAISEPVSSVKKESPESTNVNFQMRSDMIVREKTSVIQWKEEKIELCAQPNSKLSDAIAAKEDDSIKDAILDESSIIVIQAAIRGFLAHRALLKKKNIIKLQAVVRGHLVRRHAVGSLRCVQAIVKMQALVRARRARLLVEGSDVSGKQSQSNEKRNPVSMVLNSKREAKSDATYNYVSIEKLLSNRFAHQLMESTSKFKSINIKCDSSKSDSAWKWLERWMSVSSVSNAQAHESESAAEQHEKENLTHSDCKGGVFVPSDCSPFSANIEYVDQQHENESFKSCVGASTEESVNDANIINCDVDNLDLQASKSISPSSCHPELQNIDRSNLTCDTVDYAPMEMTETDLNLKVDAKSLPHKDERLSESEAKIFSRKAFQSKFEEMNSVSAAAKLDTTSSQNPEVELQKVPITTDQTIRSQDIRPSENSISNNSAVQIGGSECGTELSLSSTLDSPDRSEVEVHEIEQEPKSTHTVDDYPSRENSGTETKRMSSILGTNMSHTDTNHMEKDKNVNSATGECDKSMFALDSPQLDRQPEADTSTLQLEQGSEARNLAHKSSPDTSPRSHITITESQTTPSTHVSFRPKKRRGEKNESSSRNRSSSAGKKSLSNPSQDSTPRTSLEQLPKEHKAGKRRNSLGSSKSDNANQEPKDSDGSNSLPSYMHATESARAKAIASGSPRSSPDVQKKDIYLKKRHSLPGTNGKQESPRIKRSLSQAQPNAKENGTHSTQERNWRR